ncbi:hypothetical protein VR010_15300 [Actinomycetaceae bacterium L2_0104]
MSQNSPEAPLPPERKRNMSKFVAGIVLIVMGIFLLLGRIVAIQNGWSGGASNGAEMAGSLIAALVMIGIPLIAGIVLIIKSKPKN